MPIPKCSATPRLVPSDVGPGKRVHLAGATHCREFVVTSELKIDPITGREMWQMMEIGDEVIVPGAEKPFTGVVMTLDKNAGRAWHPAP